MLIATSNNISPIPRPLLDRIELIEVRGYITGEKVEISKRHLIPKGKENNCLSGQTAVKFTRPAIEYNIEHHTR